MAGALEWQKPRIELKPGPTDKEAADFDGDGLNNFTEINLGANPISLDSDRDGMPDAWKYQYALA